MKISELDRRISEYPRRPLEVKAPKFPLLVEGDCFIWTGGKRGGTNSRPAIMWNNQSTSAARIAYHLHADKNFDWTDQSVQIRHICGNYLCVNPEHILTGSKMDQERDKVMLEIVRFYQTVFPRRERLEEFYVYLEENFGFRRDMFRRFRRG